MKINFKSINVADLDGNKEQFDVSRDLANYLYKSTPDLGMLDFAQQMYKEGDIEVSDEMAQVLKAILEDPQCPYIAVVKREIIRLCNE